MTIRELLKYGEQLARAHGKEESAVKRLLMHVLAMEGYEIILHFDQEVTKEEIERFQEGVHQYVFDHVPIQYIIGHEYFYGYRFIVNPNVLIPRYETEELVGHVLRIYDECFAGQIVDVVDVGTGSGAIAVTLALEEPNMRVDATDISENALAVAKENAKALNAKVHFMQGDLLEPLVKQGKRYDILVSNPPYIPNEEPVDPLVKDHEPHMALFGGPDGMDFYECILKDAKKVLKPKSVILFEHGWNQREKMERLIKQYFPHSTYEILKDMNQKDRITIIKNGLSG